MDLIIEGKTYALFCPWGTVLRTSAVELVEPGDGFDDEFLHTQCTNTMGDTICVDSMDFRIDGDSIYLYDANVHFTRRHQEMKFDPYEDAEIKSASKVYEDKGIDVSWLDGEDD